MACRKRRYCLPHPAGPPAHQREVGLAVCEAILKWGVAKAKSSISRRLDRPICTRNVLPTRAMLCRLPLIPLNGDVSCKPLNSRTYCSSGAPRVMVPFPRSVSIQKAIWKQRMVSLSALRVIAAGAENWLALRLCPTGSNRGTGSQRDVHDTPVRSFQNRSRWLRQMAGRVRRP